MVAVALPCITMPATDNRILAARALLPMGTARVLLETLGGCGEPLGVCGVAMSKTMNTMMMTMTMMTMTTMIGTTMIGKKSRAMPRLPRGGLLAGR